ncbi:MAG: hypothetical protein H6519_03370 [Microthrixaceae bacterium]|nr:hypothetical protein [Acidimicrobiales bacterium]MCB9403455.1 hypothetical protein [Microthrixaceae bacterium]
MAQQLPLTNPATGPVGSVRSAWKLDEKTREAGRRGIASARAALAAHRPTDDHRPQAA